MKLKENRPFFLRRSKKIGDDNADSGEAPQIAIHPGQRGAKGCASESRLAVAGLASGVAGVRAQFGVSLRVQVVERQRQSRDGFPVQPVASLQEPRVLAAAAAAAQQCPYVGLGTGGVGVGQVERDEGEDVGVRGRRSRVRVEGVDAKCVGGRVFADALNKLGRVFRERGCGI